MNIELKYSLKPLKRGYNDRTLYINLSNNKIVSKTVTEEMKEIFVGGRGFDLWLLWNALPRDRVIEWDDPENEICISCGPLGGIPIFPGSGKSIVVTISPLTNSVMDSNVGGYFGPYLKYSGWDALEVQGKASSDVIIFIDGDEGRVVIDDAGDAPNPSHSLNEYLTKKYCNGNKRNISIVSSGPGAKNTRFGCLNFSWYDIHRKFVRYKQAGRGGTGTVFRDKKIKAIIAKYSGPINTDINNPFDLDAVNKVGRKFSEEILTYDPKQHEMRVIGSTFLVSIMNEFDLLPVNNFKFGSHPEAYRLSGETVYREKFHRGEDSCWMGCAIACSHCVKDFKLKTGPFKNSRVWVDGPEYETIAGLGSNCGIFDPDYLIEANFYCDTYGLDTISVGTSIAFAMDCYEMGLIDKSITGDLDLTFGNKEAALQVIHQMAKGKGLGWIVGQGIRRMKQIFSNKCDADLNILSDIGMEAKGLEYSEYVTKESLAQQGGYGLALKGPQHDEAWLIFLDMVQNLMPTFERKAEALHWFPMFRTWFGLVGLCKLPWNDVTPPGNQNTSEPAKFISHVEYYAKSFSGLIGNNVNTEDLIVMSERVYNFQRVFNLRMGFGTRKDDDIPYRSIGPVTKEEYISRSNRYDTQLRETLGLDPESISIEEKIKVLRSYRKSEYEILKDAVYKRRGWSREGIPSLNKIKELGIDFPDVIALIKKSSI